MYVSVTSLLGLVASIIALVAYAVYIVSVFRGNTRPHAFTWGIWGCITTIAFFAQVSQGAGPGSWVMGCTAGACFLIAAFALRTGSHIFARTDWLALIGCIIAICLWILTHNPLWSVILITFIDAIAFIPTFRKAYHSPHQELALAFFLNGLKFVFGIFALSTFNVTTWLYPASLIVTNWLFVAMVLWRRKQQD